MRVEGAARAFAAAAALCVAGAQLASCARPQTAAAVLARLPAAAIGMPVAAADELYPAAAIFSYLDGGAEVYLAYGLRECAARRYAGGGREVIVDVFDMGSSADAFGVFSRDRDGEAVAVGQGGRLRAGWLSAWKGRFYLSITADGDDAATRAGLLELGRAAAAAVDEEGAPPALLSLLPSDGLDASRVAYVHDHVTLGTLVELPGGNPLGLGEGSEVALGEVRRGSAVATLLLVRHADAAAAAAGAERLAAAWGAAPGVTARDAAGRWRAVAAQGRLVAAVTAAGDEETTHALLADALTGDAAR